MFPVGYSQVPLLLHLWLLTKYCSETTNHTMLLRRSLGLQRAVAKEPHTRGCVTQQDIAALENEQHKITKVLHQNVSWLLKEYTQGFTFHLCSSSAQKA